jgi:mannan endo-1,4-beta-mannosidase
MEKRTASAETSQMVSAAGLYRLLGAAVAFLIACSPVTAEVPITPNASPESRSLLSFLHSIYGRKIISGQQEGWRGTSQLGFELNYVQDASGKLPALLSMDLLPYTNAREIRRETTGQRIADHGIEWYVKRNGIVSLCWHWQAPMHGRAFYTKDTRFRPARAVLSGTPENQALLADIDLIAEELRALQDAGVPVLWRPLHEANGRWFWWGTDGPEPFKKLWIILFERLTVHHQLNNLIWVFSPGAGVELAAWYPGDPYVDIVAPDHYPMDGNDGPAKDIFEEMVALTGGSKLIGFGENGPVPAPDKLVSSKAGWLFFIAWSGKTLTDFNSKDRIRTAYNHPYVLTLGALPDLKTYPHAQPARPVKLGFPHALSDLPISGTARRALTVVVQDEKGQIFRNGSHTVNLRLNDRTKGASLTGKTTAQTVNGIAMFPDIAVNKPGEKFSIRATAKSLRPAVSPEFAVGPGTGIARECWTGGPFRTLADISTCPAAADHFALVRTAFESPVVMGTNFAARYRGYIIPPQDGEYVFWIANAGRSELWLSTNAQPTAKVKIAEIGPNTPYAKWAHINEAQSSTVWLEKGRRYYIEVLQLQPAGSTQLAMRWRLPDGLEERPIPGSRFIAFDGQTPPVVSNIKR